MAIKIRRWYAYNCASGGQQVHTNYFLIESFQGCVAAAENICLVLGVYEIFDGTGTTTFGNHPQTFAQDTILSSYINSALGSIDKYPTGGQKTYVYKRNC